MRPGHLCAHRCSQSTYLKAIRGEGGEGGKRAAPDRILSRVRLCAFPMDIFFIVIVSLVFVRVGINIKANHRSLN